MPDNDGPGDAERCQHVLDPRRLIAAGVGAGAVREAERRQVERDHAKARRCQRIGGPPPQLAPGGGAVNRNHGDGGSVALLLHEDLSGARRDGLAARRHDLIAVRGLAHGGGKPGSDHDSAGHDQQHDQASNREFDDLAHQLFTRSARVRVNSRQRARPGQTTSEAFLWAPKPGASASTSALQAGVGAGTRAEQGIEAAGEKIGHIVGRHRPHVIGRRFVPARRASRRSGSSLRCRRDAEAKRLRLQSFRDRVGGLRQPFESPSPRPAARPRPAR